MLAMAQSWILLADQAERNNHLETATARLSGHRVSLCSRSLQDFSFCVIKYLILAMLGVEAALAFFIILRLRIAWAVMLNRFGISYDDDAHDGSSKNPHALRFGEGVAPLMPNVIADVAEAYRPPHGRDALEPS
jgi:hypothetical protein